MAAKTTVAIGDTHGELTKLTSLMDHVRRFIGDAAFAEASFVFLGDYVDRGPDSRGVIDYVRALGNCVALMGNHEDMLVDAYVSAAAAEGWMSDYGDVTCGSFGVSHIREIPKFYVEWMSARPYYHHDGLRTFVHAGIDRRVGDIKEQPQQTLIWIRDRFLKDRSRRGGFVVHGHTPVTTGVPELCGNRLNLDTGAVYGGFLSAAVFDDTDEKPTHFVTHTGLVEAFRR
jgi:serine/threonine protein phosphatase 1